MGKQRITKTKELIDRLKELYGDTYTYEHTDFEHRDEKNRICVTCPKHGVFYKTLNKILYRKQGCPGCSNEERKKKMRMSFEEFCKKGNKVHDNRYIYTKADMGNRDENGKVCVICPEHGEFWITPSNHLKGVKCKYCAHRSYPFTTEEWVKKSKEIHGDKYIYDLAKYVNKKTPVTIVCPIHGEFEQLPQNHLKGHGCQECAGVKKLTTEQFIKNSHKIHGDRYDYSETEYMGANTDVCIICHKKDKYGNEHGEFWQTPTNHTHKTNPKGCPKCQMSHGEEKIDLLLTQNNIKHIYNANKRELKWIGRQHIDFYLPDYNVGIEYQGEQHTKPRSFGGKQDLSPETNLKNNILRDKRKLDVCKEHNFPLYYINYNENIEEKLNNILNETRNGGK